MDGKMFILGLSLGMIGGALIVANSHRARCLVKNSQEQIRQKADELAKDIEEEIDEKLDEKSQEETKQNKIRK